jgi:hypothetical protein
MRRGLFVWDLGLDELELGRIRAYAACSIERTAGVHGLAHLTEPARAEPRVVVTEEHDEVIGAGVRAIPARNPKPPGASWP